MAIDCKTKPWGYEEIWALTDKYAAKFLHINHRESLSWQYHEKKEETLFLLDGLVKVELGDTDTPNETRLLTELEPVLHIPAGKRHRMMAVLDSKLVEVSTPELDDVIRLEDKYGRTTNR